MFPWRWLALLALIPLALSANAGVKVKLTQKGLDFGGFIIFAICPLQMLHTYSCLTVHNITATHFVFLSISRQRARRGISAKETDDHQGARYLGERAGKTHRQGPLQCDRVRQGNSHLCTHHTNFTAWHFHVHLTLLTSLIWLESAFMFQFVVERLRPTLSVVFVQPLIILSILEAHSLPPP